MNFTPDKVNIDAGEPGKKELAPFEVWIATRKA
jgi:hypothetical protein